MGWFVWDGLWVELVDFAKDGRNYLNHTAILQSAEYYQVLFTLNIIVLVLQLWVAGEVPTIEWSYLRPKIVSGKRLTFRGYIDSILFF